MSTQGHNAVSHAWLRGLRRLGYSGDVYEVPLGVDPKGRQVRGDGLAKNFDVKATVLIWDARVSSSYLIASRRKAAAQMYAVTDVNELLKEKAKGEHCRRSLHGRAEFLPVVCNTHGGLGRRAMDWLREAFQNKIDGATEPAAKHSARLELTTTIAEIACAVLNRNAMIMATNAWPQASDAMPAAAEIFDGVRRDDVSQDS